MRVLIALGALQVSAQALRVASWSASAEERSVWLPGPVVRLSGHRPDSDLSGFMPAASSRQLQLEIVFALTNHDALDQLLTDQQDPTSPRYHRWLTPDQFAANFGPTQSSFEAVGDWLKSQGFSVESADIKERSIRVAGTVAKVQRAFGTTIVASEDGLSYANRSDPSIPARFEGVIARIEGLHNMHASKASIQQPLADSLQTALVPAAPPGVRPQVLIGGDGPFFGPSDFYTFYDERPVLSAGIDGSGFDCIALAEDSNFLAAAVSDFDSAFGLAAANLTTILADRKNPGRTADELETLLDIEWAHAVAPGAPIRVYVGNDGNARVEPIVDAINRAVTDNACGAISVSFSLCGDPMAFYTVTVAQILAQAASQGQTIFISSGDQGAAGLSFSAKKRECVVANTPNVNELSASPLVLSVGGTQFTPSYDDSGNVDSSSPESAWNNPPPGPGATGGGASKFFPKPAYQIGATPADGARDVPDVAMIAGFPEVPLGIDKKGKPRLVCCAGGTSLAAPVWAAIQALAGGRQGQLNPTFYANGGPRGVREVTSGDNSFHGVEGFSAGPGYNQATGFGTVDIGDYVLGPSAALHAPSRAASASRPKAGWLRDATR